MANDALASTIDIPAFSTRSQADIIALMPTGSSLSGPDHLLFTGLFLIVLASNVIRAIRRRWYAARGGIAPPRSIQGMRNLLIGSAAFAVLLIAAWHHQQRPWELLGFQWPRGGWIGIVGLLLLAGQLSFVAFATLGELPRARRDAETADELIRLTAPMRRDQSDVPRNSLVVGAMGAFEELCFRGFLYYYFTILWGWVPAALICWVSFAMAHSSQGPRVVSICLIHGGFFTILRLMTGCLWIPMLSHAVHNMIVVVAVREIEELIAKRDADKLKARNLELRDDASEAPVNDSQPISTAASEGIP